MNKNWQISPNVHVAFTRMLLATGPLAMAQMFVDMQGGD
jgi:hypothetical protein